MPRTITGERDQVWMFPPTLDDILSAEHPARFIDELVSQMDLKELGFVILPADGPGGVKYDEKLMLKLFLYAYYRKITSYRGIEELAKDNLGAIWLVGNARPDHISLWRFHKRNKEGMNKVFKWTVKASIRMGLVDFALEAVDGTKISADASKRRAFHKKDLKKIEKYIKESIKEYTDTLEASHNENKTRVAVKIPRSIKGRPLEEVTREVLKDLREEEKKALLDEVQDKIKEMDEAETGHLSETDPESRMMTNHEGSRFGYNAQIVVDSKAGIIVAADVTNSRNDAHELTHMVEEAVENTGHNEVTTIADGGYHSGRELHQAEQKGFNVLVNVSAAERKKLENPMHQSNFTYDAHRDMFYCPYGGRLNRLGGSQGKGNGVIRRYRCIDYQNCPYRDICSKNKTGRTIKVSEEEYRQARKRNYQRIQEPENKEKLKQRQGIVEHEFGHIKRNLKFRRWTLRGLENVRSQWRLICSIVNIQKMYKAWVNSIRDSENDGFLPGHSLAFKT